jgi:hypothetical protein
MTNAQFRELQADLDRVGIRTHIQKCGPKTYNLIVNFEVIKIRKQRAACRNRIIKMHHKNIDLINKSRCK